LDLGAIAISGDLNATATLGNITNTGGALAIGVNSTFTAAGGRNVTVANAGNSFGGTVTFSSGGTLNNVTVLDTTVLELEALTLSNNLTATGAGFTQTGALVVLGTATLTATNITLNNPDNDFSTVVVTSGQNASLSDKNAVILDEHNVAGNLNWTAGGAVTQSAALNIVGTTTIDSKGNNVTLDDLTNDFNEAVSVTATDANVALTDINNLSIGAINVGTGTINLAASSINNGSITANSATITAGTMGLTARPTIDVLSNQLLITLSSQNSAGLSGKAVASGKLLVAQPDASQILTLGSFLLEPYTYASGTLLQAQQVIQSESASVVAQQLLEELLAETSKADFFMVPPLLVNIDVEEIGLLEETPPEKKMRRRRNS